MTQYLKLSLLVIAWCAIHSAMIMVSVTEYLKKTLGSIHRFYRLFYNIIAILKILAIEKEFSGKTGDDFQPHLGSEAKRIWELYKNGNIREIYFRSDRANAVIILECKNLKEAKEYLSSLSLVKESLIYLDFLPLAPYPGFERLFKLK